MRHVSREKDARQAASGSHGQVLSNAVLVADPRSELTRKHSPGWPPHIAVGPDVPHVNGEGHEKSTKNKNKRTRNSGVLTGYSQRIQITQLTRSPGNNAFDICGILPRCDQSQALALINHCALFPFVNTLPQFALAKARGLYFSMSARIILLPPFCIGTC
jgi:hypothetical protein